jgi:purine nucleosidase
LQTWSLDRPFPVGQLLNQNLKDRIMATNRRRLIAGLSGALAASLMGIPKIVVAAKTKPFVPAMGARARVIYVNDLSGDIDGLFATVHILLSPTVDVRAIVATGQTTGEESVTKAADLAREMLALMGMADKVKVHEGGKNLASPSVPVPSAGAQTIIDEARRTDSQLPLYVAVGGGLSEVASALMLAPEIASKFTLVWIGGDAYPAGGTGEYNFSVDPLAAQHIFNETAVPIWQIPRSVYATCLISNTEIGANVAPYGKIGAWLYAKLSEFGAKLSKLKFNTGETWTMGDNPLVVLTALNDWLPSAMPPPFVFGRTGSSQFDEVIAPYLNPDGTFKVRTEGRKIRVYKTVDTRMMFSDLFAKMKIRYGS